MVGTDVTALVSSASKSSLDGLPGTSTRLYDDILVRGEIVGSLATSEPMCPRHSVAFRKKEGKQPL
jgi:hypothetical protein